MPTDLIVKDLSVTYRRANAVQKVNLVVPPGKITALVGANGAGKSSVLLALYGAVPSRGTIMLGDDDITKLSSAKRARRGLAIVPQGRQLFPRLTVRENLRVMANLLHLGQADVEVALDRFPILRERTNNLAGVLSGGEQQMLVVTRALMTSPNVLLLDEMTTGLSPLISQQLMSAVVELCRGGLAVLLAAPSITTIARSIDRGYVMRRGEIVATVEEGGETLDERYRESMGMRAAAIAEQVRAE